MINYKEIIDNLQEDKIKELLTLLEVPWIDKGSHIVCKTACHNAEVEEASWKLYYYKDNHLFVCYTECGNMSIFSFLKNYYEARQVDYNWYEDIYKVILDCSNYSFHKTKLKYKPIRDNYKNNKPKKLQNYPPGLLDVFIKRPAAEWLAEGITEETMEKFNIRYSISQNKIIIPHYDLNGNLVGIRGRALDSWEVENVGKYMPVQIEGKWYSHPLSLNLYGLNINKDNIKEEGICFLFEGEKSVLLCENLSRKNTSVAVCGSNLNKFVIKQLISECHPREIVICFDKEEKRGENKYFYKLYNLCKKYSNYANFSFVYDKHNLLDLKDSPIDKGEEVFEQLIAERVKI